MATQLLYGQLFQTCPLPSTDLTGRTYIITGGNSGLGLDAAKHMYRLNCSHIVLACRDTSKGEAAKTDITQSVKLTTRPPQALQLPTISVWQLDMASYKSVASFAHRVSTDLPHLNGAVLNAGVSLLEHTLSEGLETTITVNVTSTFLLAILLIPILKSQQPKDTSTSTPTITIVGSAVQHFAKTDELTAALNSSSSSSSPSNRKILKTISNDKTTMANRYFLSKLLVMMMTVQLAESMKSSTSTSTSTTKGRSAKGTADEVAVTVNCIGPGYCRTALFRHDESTASRMALRVIGRPSEEGSRTLVHGVVEAGRQSHGCYVSEGRIKKMSKFIDSAQGKQIGELLWKEMVEIAEGAERGCIQKI